MSRLDVTLSRLLRPGPGLLVLDDYADAEAARRGLPPSALTTIVDRALRSATAEQGLAGALVGEQHLKAMPPSFPHYIDRAPPRPSGLGLRVVVGSTIGSATASIEVARHLRADLVELRSNRRPGEFPRSESHVAVHPLAAAAATAQALELLPVLTVSMPGLEGSSIGVTRAVTVNGLSRLFDAAIARGVDPSRLVVRTNLIAPGPRAGKVAPPEEVAAFTLDALEEALPAEVPAVWFMSSGRPLASVCRDLEAISVLAAARGGARILGYAMGRALWEPTLDGMVSGGSARAQRHLAVACDALQRALRPPLSIAQES